MSEEKIDLLGPLPPEPIDSVLMIDGDNDPHLPPEFPVSDRTLIRVFLRQGAKMPRGLERRVGQFPMCVPVSVEKGGANAADFAMSLHAGMLHAVLPMHIQFTMVTNDKTIQAMAQELQRIGRVAKIWSSHPAEGGRRRKAAPAPAKAEGSRRRRGRGSRAKPTAATASAPEAAATAASSAPAQGLAGIAAAYWSRLSRMKNPPSRVKALLNDIKNRAGAPDIPPEEILEELKRSQGLLIDESGRVQMT